MKCLWDYCYMKRLSSRISSYFDIFPLFRSVLNLVLILLTVVCGKIQYIAAKYFFNVYKCIRLYVARSTIMRLQHLSIPGNHHVLCILYNLGKKGMVSPRRAIYSLRSSVGAKVNWKPLLWLELNRVSVIEVLKWTLCLINIYYLRHYQIAYIYHRLLNR